MVNMCNIIHDTYDKLHDRIMYLNYGSCVLGFNVDLARYDNKGNRYNYHREVGYIRNNEYRIKVNREFNYYYILEYLENGFNKLNIKIYPDDLYNLIYYLKIALSWMRDESGNSVFATKNNKVIVIKKQNNLVIKLKCGQYLELEPAGLNYNDGTYSIGVKLYLNSDTLFTFVSAESLNAWLIMLTTGNMYMMAQNLINYLGRPEYGTNLMNITPPEARSNTQEHRFLK